MGKFTKAPQKKTKKKGLTIFLMILVIALAAAVAAAGWVAAKYHIVAGKLYPKDAVMLDLREEDLKPARFDKIREKLPDCEIRWNIPFQDGALADDATEITVNTLSEKDVELLDYAWNLKTVQAEGCTDYEVLALLRQRRPEVEVNYSVAFSGGNYSWDVDTLILSSVAEADIHLLQHLPNLKTVVLSGGNDDPHTVEALQGTVHNAGLEFGIVIGGDVHLDTETSLTISQITDAELELLRYLPVMESLCLQNPEADPQKIFALRDRLPGTAISWEVTLGDQTFDETVTAVDLTMVEVTDLAEVEQKMAYLPDLESVTFGLCGVDNPKWGNSRSKLVASPIENEDLAAYRDRVRDQYKVAWTLRLGPSIALRSDADNFMPNHFGVGILPDDYAYNLRYCEDMVCLDVGHMTLTDISFVEYMPKLKYLILAWTEVQYIEPIRTCKNLVFLELDNSCIRDISPLVGCTALEDLNLGNTFVDVTPILEMTWLKNVYFILGSRANAWKVTQAIPTARVVASGDATVGGGWRRLPNYYAMRDCLHAPYMN